MKLLIDQLATIVPEHVAVAEELRKRHEILYWIRMEDIVAFEKSKFPGTIFHNYHDALKGMPPSEIDASDFRHWSRDEIVEFSEWEAELMTMMDKWYPEWPVNKRKDFYYELLRYWGGILDTLAPDCIIFNAIPHQMFNLVLYAIAKKRGIKTILFDFVLEGDGLLLKTDYRQESPAFADAVDENSGDVEWTLSDLSLEMQTYYKNLSSSGDPAPFGMREFKRTYRRWRIFLWRWRPSALWPFIKDGSIVERSVRRIGKMFGPTAKREYERLQSAPDFSVPYVYVPLHYQPEATTSPQGGIFVSQLLALRMLSAALPQGWRLYVKEHPAQWRAHLGDFTPQRYQGFYQALATLPNVFLVPTDTNTFVLTDHARTVATITGTAAWEALVRGKSVLVFGYPWYISAPGVFRVASAQECSRAFEKIAAGDHPSPSDIFKYVAKLERISMRGYLDPQVRKIASYTAEESQKDMVEALEKALRW